jgi:tetratricopeptide (TPR) repeat protein
VGKAVDMQAGVPRISDLTPTFVILGALVASYRIAIWGSVRESGTVFKEQNNVATVFPFNFLVMTSLSVTLFATLTLLFIGWDVRRVSASTIVAGEQNNEIFEKLTLAQQRAPDRSSWTFRLSEELFIASNVAHSNGLIADGNRLAIQARELLLESEKRNPYSMDTQLALATIATTMVQRGNSDFASELLERHTRIAKYYPMFPSLVGTAATAAASVGEFELAIELADQAISTESETQNWSKAWYAKGASLVLLGQVEQGIAALLIATEKEPGSQGAFLAHQVLAKVYEQQGDHDRAEFHRDQIATD